MNTGHVKHIQRMLDNSYPWYKPVVYTLKQKD